MTPITDQPPLTCSSDRKIFVAGWKGGVKYCFRVDGGGGTMPSTPYPILPVSPPVFRDGESHGRSFWVKVWERKLREASVRGEVNLGGWVLREVRDLVHRVPIVGGESEMHSSN